MNNHRNSRLWRLAVVALIPVILSIAVSACDSYLVVRGTVYEWVDAPAGNKGEIYVATAAPAGRMIKPVAGASVAFAFQKPLRITTTSENGTFEESWVTGAGPYVMDVKIEREGYRTLKGTVQVKSRDNLTIFLVRQEK